MKFQNLGQNINVTDDCDISVKKKKLLKCFKNKDTQITNIEQIVLALAMCQSLVLRLCLSFNSTVLSSAV